MADEKQESKSIKEWEREQRDDGPQTIHESGDPMQGAPNEHQSYAEWAKQADGTPVEDEQGGTTAGAPGAESFGTTPGSVGPVTP